MYKLIVRCGCLDEAMVIGSLLDELTEFRDMEFFEDAQCGPTAVFRGMGGDAFDVAGQFPGTAFVRPE
jgi:hypothetical protein